MTPPSAIGWPGGCSSSRGRKARRTCAQPAASSRQSTGTPLPARPASPQGTRPGAIRLERDLLPGVVDATDNGFITEGANEDELVVSSSHYEADVTIALPRLDQRQLARAGNVEHAARSRSPAHEFRVDEFQIPPRFQCSHPEAWEPSRRRFPMARGEREKQHREMDAMHRRPPTSNIVQGGKAATGSGRVGLSAGSAGRRSLLLEDLPQTLAVRAARHQPRSVAEDDGILAVEPGLEPLDGIDVDDRGPVHAQEAIRIEPLLEALEAVAQEVLPAAGVDLHVVARGLEPLDVGDADEVHRLAGADGDALLRAPLGADRLKEREDFRFDAAARGLRQLLEDVAHRPAEARARERLEQVVDGVYLECAERERVVGGDEDDCRGRSGSELFQDAEAVPFGHLHVEKEQRRPQLPDLRHRLASVARLADHGHVGEGSQKRPDPLARERLVVRDDRAERAHAFPSPVWLRGILTVTCVPGSGFPLSAIEPRVP